MKHILLETTRNLKSQFITINQLRLTYFIIDFCILLSVILINSDPILAFFNFTISVLSLFFAVKLKVGFKPEKIDGMINFNEEKILKKLIAMQLSCIELNDKKISGFYIFYYLKLALSVAIAIIYMVSLYCA